MPVLFNRILHVSVSNNTRKHLATTITGLFAAAFVIASGAGRLSNIPQELPGRCAVAKDCAKLRIQRSKSRKAESCTIKCVITCIWGGEGSPGEGPFNVRGYFHLQLFSWFTTSYTTNAVPGIRESIIVLLLSSNMNQILDFLICYGAV